MVGCGREGSGGDDGASLSKWGIQGKEFRWKGGAGVRLGAYDI